MKDLLIIGGGPGGLSAGIYSAIYNLDAEITTENVGGTVLDAHEIENYPGLGRTSNQELVDEFKNHIELFDIPINEGEEVVNMEKIEDGFKTITREGEEYRSRAVVIATGTQVRKLNIPGEEEYRGKGVSYCAVCDAPLYKGTEVGVVGGSEAAAKEALLLTEHADKVYIIYRGEEIHPEPILKKRIEKKEEEGEIEVINNTNVEEIKGSQMMEKVKLDNSYKGSEELEIEGLFISIGGVPLTEITGDLKVETNNSGAIKVNDKMETSVPGIYAAGDVTDNGFKQIITAAYQGSRAVNTAYQHLKHYLLLPPVHQVLSW